MNRPKPRVTTVLLSRRAAAFKRHLGTAVDGDGHGVHQARVASRRLRETVPVLAAGLKGSKAGKARRKIRRITNALGSIRELDVTLALVDELAARNTLPRIALEEVRRGVVEEQERRRGVMLKKLGRVNIDKLDRRLATVAEALQNAETEGWREALGKRLLKRSKALAGAVETAGHMYEPERLHQVRIAAKKLRYAMELAAESGIRSAARCVRTIKRAQDTLGRLHDLQVLQGYVAAAQGESASPTPPDSGLEKIALLLEGECRHLHARYLSSVPALLEVAQATRAAVVPHVLARPKRVRVLKMNLDTVSSTRRTGRPSAAAVHTR
jgi:CHAD domain-containing protein